MSNREIKFRAWDGRTIFPVDQITFNDAAWDLSKGRGVSIPYQPHIILMQFIGLFDKNGVEIYEGDIVEWHRIHKAEFKDNPDKEYFANYEVVWLNDYIPGWYLRRKNGMILNGGFGKVSVIGNIYQHPELLK